MLPPAPATVAAYPASAPPAPSWLLSMESTKLLPVSRQRNSYCPDELVVAVVATPAAFVPLQPRLVTSGPLVLEMVTTTLGMPGSPASWTPLPFMSSHIRFPIDVSSVFEMSTIAPISFTLPNAARLASPPLVNCVFIPVPIPRPSLSLAGMFEYSTRYGPAAATSRRQSPIALVVALCTAPFGAVTVTVTPARPISSVKGTPGVRI